MEASEVMLTAIYVINVPSNCSSHIISQLLRSGHPIHIALLARPDPLCQPEVEKSTDAFAGPRRNASLVQY